MRREFKQEESYIDWLKSVGCISYCPFSSNLHDLINNIDCQYTGKGSYSFNNGIMTISTPSTSIATTLNITIPNFSQKLNSEMTIMADIAKVSGKCRPTLFGNTAVNSEKTPQMYGNVNYSSIDSLPDFNICKSAKVMSYPNREIVTYRNGTVYIRESFDYNLVNMSSPYNQGMTIACAGHTNYRNCRFKIGNLMIFNKALDLTTIRKIQGYE